VVLDLADRKIIGWALSKTMKAKDTTIAAFKMAVKNRPVVQSLIFHSDRGIQYACDEFRQELGAYPLIRQSMIGPPKRQESQLLGQCRSRKLL
jgi:putative transposase